MGMTRCGSGASRSCSRPIRASFRAALPHLRRSKHPRIVNIASTEALGATALHSSYSAAKAGVVGLTRSLAVELGRDGITVNCICPGPITTGMTARISDEHKAIYAGAARRWAVMAIPKRSAHMTLSLCLPAASFLTRAIIPVDGGLMARNGQRQVCTGSTMGHSPVRPGRRCRCI